MKKALLLLPIILMTLFIGCEQMKEEDRNLNSGVSTVEQQIEEIKGSLPKFRAALKSLKGLISDKGDTKSEVETNTVDYNTKGLKQYVELLEERIEALEEYVYSNDDKSKDWLEATYATLEMYQETISILALIQSELEAMKDNMENLDSEVLQKAEENISESITSMKDWVNERLTGYYDIVAIDAKFAIVEESLASGQTELHKEISDNRDALKEALASMEAAYKDAIKDAIEENNGVIDTKIANAIADVNARIDKEIADINKKLSDLEDRISKLESSVTDLLNRIQSIAYIPLHEDNKARVNIISGDMSGANMRLDFKVSPRSAVSDISANHTDILSIKVLHEGSLNHINLQITSCSGNTVEGTLHLDVDCQNLGMDFYSMARRTRAILYISDGNNDLTSNYIDLIPFHTNNKIRYKVLNNEVEPDANTIFKGLKVGITSTEYDAGSQMWVTSLETNLGEIPEKAFSVITELTDIVLPTSVKSIKDRAFYNCSNLQSISAEQVSEIGDYAFYRCSSLHTIIGYNVKTIGAYAFSYAFSLEHPVNTDFVSCSNSLESIGAEAFANSNIFWIRLPKSVKTLGGKYTNENGYTAQGGVFRNCRYLHDIILSDGISTIEENTFSGCTELLSISLPESIDSIGKNAFSNCTNLDQIIIPDKLTYIGEYAFENCSSLRYLDVPNSVTYIGIGAFWGCASIQNAIIPEGSTEIPGRAFANWTQLTEITIPEGITSIGNSAFHGCTALSKINLPESLTSVGGYAFDGCTALTEITIPEGATSIGYRAFYGCTALSKINLPESLTSIKAYAFDGCTALTEINIPDKVTIIEQGLFNGCSALANISIPETATTIRSRAFYDCTSLEEITLPSSITFIENLAFENCSALKQISIQALTPPSIPNTDFLRLIDVIYVPTGCGELYKETWPDYDSKIQEYSF